MYDRAEIVVSGGRGGDGLVGFRKEKFVPFGGPDGGDGGDGGDVVIVADSSVSNLKQFVRKGSYKAGDGGVGKHQKKHGGRGEDRVLAVPVGTIVADEDGVIGDLSRARERLVVAGGGRGGRGNPHFATPTNQTPQHAQKGREGETRRITLELRLIADVGLVGYPNAGKSSLLAAVSAARPRIADYPFATREPVPGVIEVGNQAFVVAEIPGIIEGAHRGRGLGHDFLRHATRTRLLIHLVDGGSASPAQDVACLNNELALFDPSLAVKPQLLAVTKIDLPAVAARLPELREDLAGVGNEVYFISAETGEGVRELMAAAAALLGTAPQPVFPVAKKVFRPRAIAGKKRGKRARVGVLGGTFDPVHVGHIRVAEAVMAELGLDEVLFVPAGEPWWKGGNPVSPAEHRTAMLQLALAGEERFRLSAMEIERSGPTYTVDTMTRLRESLGPEAELFFILGWDNLGQLPRWREPSRLIELCRLVAVPRVDSPAPDLGELEREIPGMAQRLILLAKPRVDVNASAVRWQVARGLSLRRLVPEAVALYIAEHGLYASPP